MIPHERSLVERMKDKPFALIGINSDSDLDYYNAKAKEMEVTWRSFWCGPDATGGEIPAKWNVSGWPTVYILDPEGVIKYKGHGGGAMDQILEREITKAMDKAAKPSSE